MAKTVQTVRERRVDMGSWIHAKILLFMVGGESV